MKIIRTAAGCLSAAGMIKELKKKGVEVIGTDCNVLPQNFNFCGKTYAVPMGNNPNFLGELLKICDLEKPDAVISGPEDEIIAISQNSELFEKKGILALVSSYEGAKTAADKIETYNFFKKETIPTPEIYNIENAKFPAITKPRFGRGGRQISISKNKEELEFNLAKTDNPIIQEFVEGTEYTIDVFCDMDGNPLSIIPRERTKVESGISVRAKTIYDKEMIDYSSKIAKKLKLFGPSCIQCIKGNDLKFIEINPRFGGGSILSLRADETILENLLRIIRKEVPVKSKGFKEGLTMMRFYEEYIF